MSDRSEVEKKGGNKYPFYSIILFGELLYYLLHSYFEGNTEKQRIRQHEQKVRHYKGQNGETRGKK